MVTISLPPELERVVNERAQQQGTTPELFLLDDLRERFLQEWEPMTLPVEGETMGEFLKEFIGCVDSSDVYPEGSSLSEDTGRKFTALLMENRDRRKL